MADNDRGHDKLNSVDVYLDTIAKHIRVYQKIKKEFPHLAVGADDLIRSLKQLEKDLDYLVPQQFIHMLENFVMQVI